MRRRPNREINIFNLSMLDVICSALGAFLILYLLSSQNTSTAQSQRDAALDQLDQCRQELKACQSEPCASRCPCDTNCPCAVRCPCPQVNCAQQCPCATNCPCDTNCPCASYCTCPNPPAPFVVVLLRWQTPNVDVDLHVTNPQGNVCFFPPSERTACGGELVHDYRNQGFTEIFIGRRIPLEDRWWTVGYHYYSGSAPVEVSGFVYYADGLELIPPRTLTPADNARGAIPMLRFKADPSGRIRFR